MKEKFVLVLKILCVVLSLAIAGTVIYIVYADNQKEKEEAAARQEIIDEASSYERQLRELKNQLNYLKESITYSSEEEEIIIGFVVTDASDLDYIEEQSAGYDFSPVIIIDCTFEMTTIADIIEAVDDSWEIMLYDSAFSEEENVKILSVMAYMESVSREYSGVFFLRNDYRTDANIQLLKDDGFIGFTYYHTDTPTVGQTDDGMVYFDYSYISSSNTTVTSRLVLAYDSKASIIVTFDMSTINSGYVSKDYVTSLIDYICANYMIYDDCSFSTIASVVEKLLEINSIEAENQAKYDEQSVEIQSRIDELQEIINGIYDRLE